MRFTVLSSGSRGNASLVRLGGLGMLIDIGLGPRVLEERMAQVGADWSCVAAVVLTHTHGDHAHDASLSHLARLGIALHCHAAHRQALRTRAGFMALEARRLVRVYDERPWIGPLGMRVEPIEAHHDDTATFGFRLEGRASRREPTHAIGYLADTGMWTAAQADALADVDVLGLEFNHDVAMQKASGRPAHLIRRVLGHRGHLSNEQGAELLCAVLGRSRRNRVRTVVLLHLSEQCNLANLARATAQASLREARRRAEVHVASSFSSLPEIDLSPPRRTLVPALPAARRSKRPSGGACCQTLF